MCVHCHWVAVYNYYNIVKDVSLQKSGEGHGIFLYVHDFAFWLFFVNYRGSVMVHAYYIIDEKTKGKLSPMTSPQQTFANCINL